MDVLSSLLVQKPLSILLVAAVFLAGYLALSVSAAAAFRLRPNDGISDNQAGHE